jgi:acetyl-CoA acetyltransferase family protein
MGCFAENTADRYAFTREAQDAFAAESVRRALAAVENGAFAAEITPVTVKGRKGETRIERDETPFTCDLAKIPQLKPAFRKDGTVTAASSSSISDGAAALVLMSEAAATARGLTPLARIVAYTSHAHEPEWFTTAPVAAIRSTLARAGWTADGVDLFEVNEAFAAVAMAAAHDIGIPADKLNINGGACALGHPVGATGARSVATAAARPPRSPSSEFEPARPTTPRHEPPDTNPQDFRRTPEHGYHPSPRRHHRWRIRSRQRSGQAHRRPRRSGRAARHPGRPGPSRSGGDRREGAFPAL